MIIPRFFILVLIALLVLQTLKTATAIIAFRHFNPSHPHACGVLLLPPEGGGSQRDATSSKAHRIQV